MNEIRELIDRLDSAIETLALLRDSASEPADKIRLGGKVEGVKLARSFVVDTLRTPNLEEDKCPYTFAHTKSWCGNARCRDL